MKNVASMNNNDMELSADLMSMKEVFSWFLCGIDTEAPGILSREPVKRRQALQPLWQRKLRLALLYYRCEYWRT